MSIAESAYGKKCSNVGYNNGDVDIFQLLVFYVRNDVNDKKSDWWYIKWNSCNEVIPGGHIADIHKIENKCSIYHLIYTGPACFNKVK